MDHIVDIKKALGTTEAGTVLVQQEIDKIIAQIVEYKNPLRMNLARRQGSGDAWLVTRRTPGTTGAQWVSDTDAGDIDQGAYTRTSFPYKTILAKGRVSRKLQAIGKTYVDVLAEEIEAQSDDFKDKEDYAITRGDATTQPKEYDGLDILISAAQTVVMATDNTGLSVTLAKVDEAVDLCAQDPDMIVCSKRTRRQLRSVLQAQQQFVNTVDVNGGFILLSYDHMPIFVSTNIVNTMQYNGSTKTISGYTGGDTSAMYVLENGDVFIAELTPVTMLPLAKTSSQYDEFEIFADEVLVLKHTNRHAKLIGISS